MADKIDVRELESQNIIYLHLFPVFFNLMKMATIKFEQKLCHFDNQFAQVLSCVDFCGFSNPTELYVSLNDCTTSGIKRILLHIEELEYAPKIKFISDALSGLSCLKEQITIQPIKYPLVNSCNQATSIIYLLPQVEFIGPIVNLSEEQKLLIQSNASCFVEKYFLALQNAETELNSILLRVSSLAYSMGDANDLGVKKLDRIKTSLNIHDLGYLFKVLFDEGILIMEKGQAEKFYRFIANNFASVQCDEFTNKSFKNKFLEAKPGVPESVYPKLKNMLNRVLMDFSSDSNNKKK